MGNSSRSGGNPERRMDCRHAGSRLFGSALCKANLNADLIGCYRQFDSFTPQWSPWVCHFTLINAEGTQARPPWQFSNRYLRPKVERCLNPAESPKITN
jgi:hypothetical protein